MVCGARAVVGTAGWVASWTSPSTAPWGCPDPHWVSATKVSPSPWWGKTVPRGLLVRGDPQLCAWPLAWGGTYAGEKGEKGSAEEEEEEAGVRAPTGALRAGARWEDRRSHPPPACPTWAHTSSRGGNRDQAQSLPCMEPKPTLARAFKMGLEEIPCPCVPCGPVPRPVLPLDKRMPQAHPGPSPSPVLACSPCPHL